jgi:ATP-binding cassette subfamily B protein
VENGSRRKERDRKEGQVIFSYWEDLRIVLPYLRHCKKLAALSVLLTLAGALAPLLDPLPLAFLLNYVLGDRPPPEFISAIVGSDKYSLLAFAVGAGVVVALLPPVLRVASKYVNTRLEQGVSLDFRSDLFEHCQGLSQAYYDDKSAGDFIYRINTEARAAGSIVVGIPPVVQRMITTVAMVVIAFQLDSELVLLSLVAVPFIYYSTHYYAKRIHPHLVRVRDLEGVGLKMISEGIRMLGVIVSFNRQGEERRRFRAQGEHAVQARLDVTLRQTVFGLVVALITALGTALVLGVGGMHVLQGSLTVGGLIIVLSYIRSAYVSLEALPPSMARLQQWLVDLKFARSLFDVAPDVQEAPDARAIGRAEGAVAFEGVHFNYPGRDSTLTDISFEVRAGGTVAIVGATGAGKTTLVSLLPRFRDPCGGRILLDGVDTRELKLDSLRAQISVVQQEPLLFSGTVAENIRYGRLDATDDDVIEAAKAANVHDFIEGLPDAYDTWLGERGAKVSGGERQRMAVARAFLKDAPILILDEPTSSVDSKTESVILAALDRLMAGRTTFLIAHRLSTIHHADQIIVLDQGELVERGSHEELIRSDGLYRRLFQLQARLHPKEERAETEMDRSEREEESDAEWRRATALLRGDRAERGRVRVEAAAAAPNSAFPQELLLTPVSRQPTVLAPATVQAVLGRGLPVSAASEVPSPPGASIVVVTHNNLVFTRMCLESVLANTPVPSVEVVVVDNASSDGTVDYLRDVSESQPNVRPIFNQENVGFGPATNQGLRHASGEVLVLLNNDTIVPPGWLERLCLHLADPELGLVGPVTNHAGNEARIEADYRTYGELVQFAQRRAELEEGRLVDIAALTMFCVALRRDVYERVGPLDERFELGMFEDDDYSLRVRALGQRVACAHDVFVHHFGQASFGKLFASGEYMALFEANRRRFELKWGMSWTPHQERLSPDYRRLREAVRNTVCQVAPPDATVMVASKGDSVLLDLGGRRAWHFPHGMGGGYAGHYPADSGEAIRQVEHLRDRGADFLVFPSTALWWLEHYPGLREHLGARYRQLQRDGIALIYSLRESSAPVARSLEERRTPSAATTAATSPGSGAADNGNGKSLQGPAPFCIAGMHRSGTSMVARTLNLVGVYLGEHSDLLRPTPENPDGYWEHRGFLALNEQLLDELGGGWDCPPTPPEEWLADDPIIRLGREGQALIERFPAEVAWAWKDPRNSITLPFWRQLIPELRVVVCLRNPLEVALSLRRRGSFSQRLSLALWKTYNQRILESTEPEARLITRYESFLSEPADELRRILEFLALEVPDSTIESACAAVKPELRQNRCTTDDLLHSGASSEVIELYTRMAAEARRALPRVAL